nr:hypothetical protein [Pseudobutyrivibrio sp.]
EKEKKPPTGPTAKELAEQIEDAKSELKRKELAVRIGQSKLEEMENTDTSGNIKATVSGTITNLQSPDNYNSTKPFFIVTATDEYYISALIGEFYLDSINVGDVVDIMSWETGLSAQATIVSVSDSPSDDGNYYGGGNSNSSSYEFKASFDKSSGIEIGSTVDVTINPSGQASSSLYIPSQFVREDSSGTYVMRKNDKNKLEKVYFSAGKTLWGSMIEVKDGVSINDYLAFPYGNGAIEGIECKEVESLTY